MLRLLSSSAGGRGPCHHGGRQGVKSGEVLEPHTEEEDGDGFLGPWQVGWEPQHLMSGGTGGATQPVLSPLVPTLPERVSTEAGRSCARWTGESPSTSCLAVGLPWVPKN